jgi:GNAT superfamily N-acetyltransferase
MTKHDFTVRAISGDELHHLLELYAHLHSVDEPLPPPAEVAKLWHDILANPLLHYFGVEFDGRIVSACMLCIVPNLTHSARPFGVIENVVTHSDYRRMGFARVLLHHALQFAWQANCHKVMLLSSVARKEAHSLYESVGFSRHAKIGYVATPQR